LLTPVAGRLLVVVE